MSNTAGARVPRFVKAIAYLFGFLLLLVFCLPIVIGGLKYVLNIASSATGNPTIPDDF